MNKLKKQFLLCLSGLAFLMVSMSNASACAVCFGKAGTPITEAANGAIIFMLILLFAVLFSFIGFMVYLVRKARQPLPEHQLLIQMVQNEDRSA